MSPAKKDNITEKLDRILLKDFEIKKELIRPEAELVKDLEIDSLDIIDLVVLVERNFGIKVDNDDLSGIRTVNDLYEFVRKHKTG